MSQFTYSFNGTVSPIGFGIWNSSFLGIYIICDTKWIEKNWHTKSECSSWSNLISKLQFTNRLHSCILDWVNCQRSHPWHEANIWRDLEVTLLILQADMAHFLAVTYSAKGKCDLLPRQFANTTHYKRIVNYKSIHSPSGELQIKFSTICSVFFLSWP